MSSKIYEKTKIYITNNYRFLLFLLILFLIFTIKLPYYISAPGGILNTKDKIEIATNFKLKGSLNMAYVTEIEGTIPMLTYAMINPNWDVKTKDKVIENNESYKDLEYRNKMLLKEANNIATIVAYNHSNIDYKTENNKVYVTYIDKLSKTNLKIKDQIIKIDNQEVNQKQDLYDYIATKKPKEKVNFTVLRNGKKKNCKAKLINIHNKGKVGIVITETLDIKSDYHIDFTFKDTESGSSGGLMMTLTLYSYLNKIDLTKGKKITGTGTIDKEGKVGEISGIKYKLMGAVKEKSDVFLVPQGKNYIEARNLKNKNNYNIKIIPVETFDEALKYLKKSA